MPTPTLLCPTSSSRQLNRLLPYVVPLARGTGSELLLLHVRRPTDAANGAAPPEWLAAAAAQLETEGVSAQAFERLGWHTAGTIREVVREVDPSLLVLSWSRTKEVDEGDATLTDLLLDVPCDLAVLRVEENAPLPRRLLTPVAGGPNARLALSLAPGLISAYNGSVTVLSVVPPSATDGAVSESKAAAKAALHEHLGADAQVMVVRNRSPISGIVLTANSGDFDLVMIGASREGVLQQRLFGAIPDRVAQHARVPVLVFKRPPPPATTALVRTWKTIRRIAPALTEADKIDTDITIRRNAAFNVDFITMLGLSTIIAALGLLLNSPAVVIGAMVVAPLMSAIVAIGLGVVIGDKRALALGLGTAGRGVLLAVLVGLLIGLLLPGDSITGEMSARGSPSLLDLGVALAAGAAGAYALCRRGVSSSLAGVAIAVALVPPLATVGLALSVPDLPLAAGASLLFLTNLAGIAAASGVVFLLLGFQPDPARHQRMRLFARGWGGLLLLLLLVTVLLASLTTGAVRSVRLASQLERSLTSAIAAIPGASMRDFNITADDGPNLAVDVEVLARTPISSAAAAALEQRLSAALQRPVSLSLVVLQATLIEPEATPSLTPTDSTSSTP